MGLLDRINNAVADYVARQSQAGERRPGAVDKQETPQQSANEGNRVTLGDNPAKTPQPRLPLGHYKSSVGQDLNFVRETLRHKIAEYGLNPALQLQVRKSPLGGVELSGGMPNELKDRISRELNHNKGFVDALSRLSVGQPTLEYVDNVMKLSQAYGAGNNLFQSVLSQDNQFNGLHDIAHRLNAMRNTVAGQSINENFRSADSQGFKLSFNTRV